MAKPLVPSESQGTLTPQPVMGPVAKRPSKRKTKRK